MPKFNKKCPKNWREYFDPASDEAFKAAHPIGYWVLVTVGILAFIAPMIGLIIFDSLTGAPGTGWIILGLIGCMTVGVGLFNIVAAWIDQYLGHTLTAVCLLGGGAIIAAYELLNRHVSLTAIFGEDVVLFWVFGGLLYPLILLGAYVVCRVFVISPIIDEVPRKEQRLRGKRIKEWGSTRDKLMKGFRNRIWYESLYRTYTEQLDELGFCPWYRVNKLFTCLCAADAGLFLLLGWTPEAALPLGILAAATGLVAAGAGINGVMAFSRREYGRPFVWFSLNSDPQRHGKPVYAHNGHVEIVCTPFAMLCVLILVLGPAWLLLKHGLSTAGVVLPGVHL